MFNILDKAYIKSTLFMLLTLHYSTAYSENNVNLILLPDPFSCHQAGIEVKLTTNTKLGILAVNNCKSDRPAYGRSNNNVTNTFSRVLLPWTYAFNGAMEDGMALIATVGIEEHQFRTNANSSIDVTFIDFGAYFGYQWYWNNGLNVTATAGLAILYENKLNKNISVNESTDVVNFLNNNSKSNIHPGFGVVLGWAF